jgi:fructokinase
MKNFRIYTIGETVYDIIIKDSYPIAAKAGGSMLNASVSLGRLGLQVELISEIGNDQVGRSISAFLSENKVGTKYMNFFNDGKTAIAIAYLDENEDATYSFYHQYPKKRLRAEFPKVKKDDIVLFGSYFSISPDVRPRILGFVEQAREVGALIVYDPNFRNPHMHLLPKLRSSIEKNISLADIVRGSNEDFNHIFNLHSPTVVYDKLREFGNPVLIYTSNSSHATFVSDKLKLVLPVPQIKPISTVGAGDSFNAGVIYSLSKLNVSRSDIPLLKKQDWEMVLATGILFGSHVCESFENYISTSLGEKLKAKPAT